LEQKERLRQLCNRFIVNLLNNIPLNFSSSNNAGQVTMKPCLTKTIFFIFSICFTTSIFPASELDLATLPLDFCQFNGQSLVPKSFRQKQPNAKKITTTTPAESNSYVAQGNVVMNGYPYIFQSGFDSVGWTGHLKKFALTVNPDNDIRTSKQFLWDAGEILTHSTPPLKRTIATFDANIKTTVLFKFANLPVEAQNNFNKSPNSDESDDLGSLRVDYIYGDRQMEHIGNQSVMPVFRRRAGLLGDIINSSPVFEGGAEQNKIESNYQTFVKQIKGRSNAIYVGANDGMLHAFSADTGFELFSYIPGPLLNKLPRFTAPSWQHNTLMDGKIRVGEAKISGEWKTVLAAGMGGGAKGIFALDVTRPDSFMEGRRAFFEFTEKDDSDIGYILTVPHIVKINDGKISAGNDAFHYFVAVPSGYNSANTTGDNFLFLISLEKAPNAPWILNNNYYKIKTSTGNNAAANALSSPGLALDIQGRVIYAYAGDLQGNIWRFDFSKGGNPGAIKPLSIFTAIDSKNNPQPITGEPVISYAPGGGYLIHFGTGKYVDHADTERANFKTNSYYTIRDTKSADIGNYLISGRSKLAGRLFSDTLPDQNGGKINGDDFIFGDGTDNTKKGWYLDFNNGSSTGERSISTGLIAYGSVYFNTLIPPNSCNERAASKSYQLDLLTGKTAGSETTTGKVTPNTNFGTPFLIPGKLTFAAPDAFGRRTNMQYYTILNFGSSKAAGVSPFYESDKATLKAGRLSWREIQNWQDFK
jgi:type IV pilus assembly protein PilY1